MVEVVVSFTKGDKGGEDVVAWRVTVVEWLVTEPVSKRVNTEGGLLDNSDTKDTSVDEATNPIVPQKACNCRGQKKTHGEDDGEVVLVLPSDNGRLVEVGDISASDTLGVLLHEHPAKVRVEETFADGVWVLVGVCIAVVRTVVSCPPSDGALNGTATNGCEEDL